MAGQAVAIARKRGDGPDPIDVHVGQRVRLRRTLLGLSQEKLGEAIGITFQQVQKYERGTNRISASRLHSMAIVLDVPISYFFDDQDESVRPSAPTETDELYGRETLELVRAYYAVKNPSVRKRVVELIRSLGAEA